MNSKTVLLTRKIPKAAEQILLKEGFKLIIHKDSMPISRTELLKKSRNMDAVISLLTESIDKEFIDNLTR